MGNYTLEDLEQAKAELESWGQRFDNYSGNNPNKYQADPKQAREKIRIIEFSLSV